MDKPLTKKEIVEWESDETEELIKIIELKDVQSAKRLLKAKLKDAEYEGIDNCEGDKSLYEEIEEMIDYCFDIPDGKED